MDNVTYKKFSDYLVGSVFVILFVGLAVIMTINSPFHVSAANTQEMSQVCGQGIVIRTDGSVIIDSWKQFSPTAGMNMPNINGMLSRPVGVTFGNTLEDKTKTCFESPEGDGVVCFPLGEVRKKMGVKQ